MTLKLNGSSSGHVNLDAKAAAASNTLTLPDTANGELVAADSSGHINLADGKEIKLGTGGDLTITHDGSNASISNDTGAFVIQDSHAGANAIIVRKGAEVELLHNNVLACETSANGLAFPAGKGIDFSATSNSAASGASTHSEVLDDYEEGYWEPTMYATGSSGNPTGDGFYTKIGNVVHLICAFNSITWSSPGSGGIAISGLPFAQVTSGDVYPYATPMTHNVNNAHLNRGFFVSGTIMEGIVMRDNLSWQSWSSSEWDSADMYLRLGITYRTSNS